MNTSSKHPDLLGHSSAALRHLLNRRILTVVCGPVLAGCIFVPGSILSSDPEQSGQRVTGSVAAAPAAPCDLAFISAGELRWDSQDADIEYFTIYGSDSGEFNRADATVVIHPLVPRHDVSWWRFDYYHVTATDFDGRESPAASIVGLSTAV